MNIQTIIKSGAVAVCAAAISAPLSAADVTDSGYPYAGVGGNYVFTDSNRDADDGAGYQLQFGVPLTDYDNYAVEFTFFDNNMERVSDGNDDYQTGLIIDLVREFGRYGWGEDSKLPPFVPFAMVGLAAVEEDVQADKNLHAGVSLGGGALFELPWKNLALRAEARYLGQFNDESAPGEDFLGDVRIALGVQFPLGAIFDRDTSPSTVEAERDCDLAVVDPETGRKDCVTDSDGDGVPDSLDRCPETPDDTEVDSYGCALKVDDADGDGVPDARDRCPNTRPGLAVNDRGCAIDQNLVTRKVTFALDSAALTSEGRTTLNEIAATLEGQENLVFEIAGHTDSTGAEQYNFKLSRERAKACREYLIEQGIDASRMVIVGYGEFEPVASNDTAEGRAKNRRVEFHLVVE